MFDTDREQVSWFQLVVHLIHLDYRLPVANCEPTGGGVERKAGDLDTCGRLETRHFLEYLGTDEPHARQ